MIQQQGQGVMDGRCGDQMIVIQHQQAFLPQCGDVVEQHANQCLRPRRLRRLQQGQGLAADRGGNGLNCGDQIAQKGRGSLSPSSSESQATLN